MAFADAEKQREYRRNWQREFRKNNPDYYRQRYQKNREKIIEQSRAYYKKNLVGGFKEKLRSLLYNAKRRAEKKNIEYAIDETHFRKTSRCPLLGIKLSFNNGRSDKSSSPSIDRIDPAKGYVPGNVWIISTRANQIKNDATLDELLAITRNLQKKLQE